MSGANIAKIPLTKQLGITSGQKVLLTPEMAMQILETNTMNRPISDGMVERITRQIRDGKWKFNGDTIKLSDDEEVLDGQHRLWAVIQAKTAVETIIVTGISREAFCTIDTIRKPRSVSDTIALTGQKRWRQPVAHSLMWLKRWQDNTIEDFRASKNRIENSDVEAMFAANPNIVQAVERTWAVRSVISHAIVAFMYYVMFNRNETVAERFVETLSNPGNISVNDPIYKLRVWALAERVNKKGRDPIVTIALIIKAVNAVHKGQRPTLLIWKRQGKRAEAFPKLEI